MKALGIGVGLLLLGIAGYLFIRGQNLERNGEQVTGTVTGFTISVDSEDNSQSYCPSVQYTTRSGQRLTYNSSFCSSPPAYEVGQQVEILYDPNKPDDAQIKGFWVQYLTIIILSCIGLPFLALGIGAMLPRRNKSAG